MLKSKRWKNSRGEVINVIQKFKSHFYFHCQKNYASGEELKQKIMSFFDHIAGISNDHQKEIQEWQRSSEWRNQVHEFRQLCDPLLSAEKLESLRDGMFTSRIETLHGNMLLTANKTKLFNKTMVPRFTLQF